jgi:hypothetical protein
MPPEAARASRAIGAMFFSAFGGAWLALWANARFPGSVSALAAVLLPAALLLACAYRTYRRHAAALRALRDTPAQVRRDRLFNRVNAGQWILVFLVALLLSRTGHAGLILPAVIFIVGAHFIPLAWLFGYPPHYLTGAALMLLAVLYPLLAEGGATSAVGALGAGLILLASALWAILPRPAAGAPQA